MTIGLDELEQRLRELPVAEPDAAVVTARVLSASRDAKTARASTRRRINPLSLRGVATAIAGLAVVWGIFYFSPAAGAALADTPGVGPVSSLVLKEAGLGTGSSVTSEDAAAAQSGVTLRLVGATASPLRTVLLVKISPASYVFAGGTLTDQFGTSYEVRDGYGDLRTGDWAVICAPPSFAAGPLGMRFTFTVDGMYDSQGSAVPGTWKVSGSVLTHSGRTVAAPAAASVGSGTISFSSGTEADGMLEMTAHVRGIPIVQLPSTKQTAPPDPTQILTATVTDSSGMQLDASVAPRDEPGGWAIDIIAYGLSDHGTYTIVISIPGSGTVSRTIAI
jgi:hypothetical protein